MAVTNKSSALANQLQQEARIRKLEMELQQLRAGSTSDGTTRRETASVPEVSGLRVVPNLNTVTFEWNPIDQDVRFYEVQIATNAQLSNPTTRRTTDFRYTYQEGNPDIPYYFRVRAVTINNQTSPWSSALNSETGKVETENLDDNSASALTQDEQTVAALDNNDTADSSPALSFTTVGGICLLFASAVVALEIVYSSSTFPSLETTLVVDGVESGSFTASFGSNVPAGTEVPLAGFQIPLELEAGEHTIAMRYTTNRGGSGSNEIHVDFTQHTISVVELRSSPSLQ